MEGYHLIPKEKKILDESGKIGKSIEFFLKFSNFIDCDISLEKIFCVDYGTVVCFGIV